MAAAAPVVWRALTRVLTLAGCDTVALAGAVAAVGVVLGVRDTVGVLRAACTLTELATRAADGSAGAKPAAAVTASQ